MQKIPKYKGLRIYLVAFILYYMLISPMSSMLYVTNFPKMHRYAKIFSGNDDLDSLGTNMEIKINKSKVALKDTVDRVNLGIDENPVKTKEQGFVISSGNKKKPKKNRLELETLFLKLLIAVFVMGFLYSLPFKIYFRRKRKNKPIPVFIQKFCKKTLIYSPLIHSGIASIVFIINGLYMVEKLFVTDAFQSGLKREIYLQYWLVFLLAGLLTVTFIYYWQKHRVQIKYLQFIYTNEELRKSVYRFKAGKIKYRLLISSTLTTLLPLIIVVVYMLLSITSLKELNIYAPSQTELTLIFGGYYRLFNDPVTLTELLDKYNLYYFNVPDTILMFIGIGMGIFVSIIYLLFFVYWTNSSLLKPIAELLKNMQKTTGGKLNNYSIVRTNDEIGDLAENYNVMTSKLGDYISDIAKMNAELEVKVKERTAEIEAQKEEIEAQRDEVESQRDEIEQQRDYVINQRDLISTQNKAITDSIEYAGNIQRALLPPDDVLRQCLGGHFIFYKPKDIVSGDFYWIHKKENQGYQKQVFIVAADCTGHGVPGAFLSMLGTAFLNEIVINEEEYRPAKILDKLKTNVIKSLHQTGEIGKSRDGIDIALCYIDFENLKLEYAGAYNPVYIVRKITNDDVPDIEQYKNSRFYKIEQKNGCVLIEIKADKIPIGVSPKQGASFIQKEFNLEEGDFVYMFSDGYVDQFGGTKRLKFLYSRFKETLISVNNLSIQQQLAEIEKIHNKWKGDEKQIDDILLIGIQI